MNESSPWKGKDREVRHEFGRGCTVEPGPSRRWEKDVPGLVAAAAAAAKSLQSCPTVCDLIDGSRQAPPSQGFSRQEHRGGLPLSSPMHESEK